MDAGSADPPEAPIGGQEFRAVGAVQGRVALLRPDHLRVRADPIVNERFAAR